MTNVANAFMGGDSHAVIAPVLVTLWRLHHFNCGSMMTVKVAALMWLQVRNEGRACSAVSDRTQVIQVLVIA